jgi:hypothetical protein
MDSELLSSTFVDLADTMVADFDAIDFLHILTDRSVRLLPASAAGVLLADPRGKLRVAASSDAAGMLELFQIQNDQGPCMDCLRNAQAVTAADLTGPDQRWPRFASAAVNARFRTVQALPMRLRDEVIGALNLFGAAAHRCRPQLRRQRHRRLPPTSPSPARPQLAGAPPKHRHSLPVVQDRDAPVLSLLPTAANSGTL